MVNLDNISFIEDSHGKKAVILSIEAYEEIKEKLEELDDLNSYIKVKSENQESFPVSISEKLVLGDESNIKIIREYRGYSLTKLARQLGISEAYLSQIENKKRRGNIDLYKKISQELDIDIDLLI
ncbi:helix-turn-helix domain-containing protein [Candidatus Tisiphia endosymbiont of Hybos culiciformis]|uniref:helix-turn-helix domain-containing protein n=1 Tax=Candidatus Tisiphia endosymbiont of Hybos culiciformis TaxID=3139331 RepID=UPI003CCA81E7